MDLLINQQIMSMVNELNASLRSIGFENSCASRNTPEVQEHEGTVFS
jgi:hypothetical protein